MSTTGTSGRNWKKRNTNVSPKSAASAKSTHISNQPKLKLIFNRPPATIEAAPVTIELSTSENYYPDSPDASKTSVSISPSESVSQTSSPPPPTEPIRHAVVHDERNQELCRDRTESIDPNEFDEFDEFDDLIVHDDLDRSGTPDSTLVTISSKDVTLATNIQTDKVDRIKNILNPSIATLHTTKIGNKVKCNFCQSSFSRDKGGSTSSIIKHIKSKHADKLKLLNSPQLPQDSSSPNFHDIFTMSKGGINKTTEAQKYNKQIGRDLIMKMVVKDDLAFSIVDSPHFRTLINTLRPGVTDDLQFGRKTLKILIEQKYNEGINVMKNILQKVPGRISFTTDAWTSKNQHPFVGVTYHYIDSDWNLNSGLLAFDIIEGDHSGANLGLLLLNVFRRYNIQHKVLAITTDNASNNDTMMGYMEDELNMQKSWSHIRCIGHVLNLIGGSLLKRFRKKPKKAQTSLEDDFNDSESSDSEDSVPKVGYPLHKIATLVRKIRKSPQLIQKFYKHCSFHDMKEAMPIIDVQTRWNSTFFMLEMASKYRQPLDDLASKENWKKLRVSADEWRSLGKLSGILKALQDATTWISGSNYATIYKSAFIYEFISAELKECKRLTFGDAILLESIECATVKLEKYYDRLTPISLIATVLDPSKNIAWFELAWKKNPDWIKDVKTAVEDAFRVYSQLPADSDIFPTTDVMEIKASLGPSSLQKFINTFQPATKNDDSLNELQIYLKSPTINLDILKCNPLGWWKINELVYPTLAKIARDYLAVPASSVPCEQIFSGGADLVTSKRSSLSADSITECMCLKNWL